MNADPPAAVVLLTPPGRGAIATVLVEGPGATAIVERWLLPAAGGPLSGQPIDRIVVGHWGGPSGDEVVVCRRGLDRVEIHCHGGPVPVRAIIEALVDSGCQAVPWADWGPRGAGTDAVRAEARAALSRAVTLPAAAILLDQHAGVLRAAIERIMAELAGDDLPSATASLRAILRYAPLGLHLVDPWRVVITGPPNVGKTTLLNALLGYRRGIVHDRPGTTRDVVTAATALDGWSVELADTAGLRTSCDAVEAAGIELASERLRTADAIVLVFDASRPASPADGQLATAWPGAIRVMNKSDLPRRRAVDSGAICVSAVTGAGIGLLESAVVDCLVPDAPPPGAPVPFCSRQVTALERALAEAAGGDAGAARQLLDELLDGRGQGVVTP